MIPNLPGVPPQERYADGSRFGFFLEWPPDDPEGRYKASITEIVNSKDYVELVLNPQTLSQSKPFATAITFTQGGGKIVESKGLLSWNGSLSGTTGFLPIPSTNRPSRGRLVDFSSSAEEDRARRSGFKAFHELRHLFEVYGHEHRKGNQVRMHYMDFRDDDFWLIEPMTFSFNRSAPKNTFTYDYDIKFIGLEPSGSLLAPDPFGVENATALSAISNLVLSGASDVAPIDLVANNPAHTAVSRIAEIAEGARSAVSLVPTAIGAAFSEVLATMDDVVAAWTSATNLVGEAWGLKEAVLDTFEDARQTAFERMGLSATFEELSEGPLFEWNELLLEVGVLADHLRVSYQNASSSGGAAARTSSDVTSLSEVHASGASTDLITDTGSPLLANPFVGSVSPVQDPSRLASSNSFRTEFIHRNETIYDVALRTLGSIYRYVDLVLVNDLQAPYIVDDISDKPSGTLAWGERIRVPMTSGGLISAAPSSSVVAAYGGSVTAPGTTFQVVDTSKINPWRIDQWVGFTVTLTSGAGLPDPVRYVVSNDEDTLVLNRAWAVSPTVGDSYTLSLQQFTLHIAPTPEEVAYGRDALLVFSAKDGSFTSDFKASPVWNSRNDIATVAGKENYFQAARLCASTARGSNKFHPGYGIGVPIGSPGDITLLSIYSFFAKQAFLEDPRTAEVRDLKFRYSKGTAELTLYLRPVNVHKASSLSIFL